MVERTILGETNIMHTMTRLLQWTFRGLRLSARWAAVGLALTALILLANIKWQPVHAQSTCAAELGTGKPPLEIDPSVGPGTCGFLQFSWRAFLAMNWPPLPVAPNNTSARARGLPDRTKVIGKISTGDNETVWEQYQPNWYLFSPNNPPPGSPNNPPPAPVNGESFAAWNQNARLPAACGPQNLPSGAKILSALSKFDPMPGVTQATSQPLIDQAGHYARYEIRLSYETFHYINKNQFYLKSAQTPTTVFDFPKQVGNVPGAIFVKAAWKVLTQAERDSHRFHETRAWMFTPASTNVQSTCVGPVQVGLVGLHIVQKTEQFPKQLWATFEHVDNAPADPANPGTQSRWSFFNPQSSKPENAAPSCPSSVSGPCKDWQPTSTHLTDLTGGPTQIKRVNPMRDSPNQPALDQINESMRQVLRQVNSNSRWQFYRLIDAQWERADTSTGFFPPTNVANVTMETYTHLNPSTNSCMQCHDRARGANTSLKSDMSFELRLGWDPVVLPNQ
jgi:hypothetical protein